MAGTGRSPAAHAASAPGSPKPPRTAYFYTPDEWDLNPIRPAAAYHHVYPWSVESLHRMAFFFEADHFDAKKTGAAHKQLKDAVVRWNRVHSRSHLVMLPRKSHLLIVDTRPDRKRMFHRLHGLERDVYELCWKIRGARDIERTFEASPERISAVLKKLVADQLMLQSGDRFLAIATDPRMDYKNFPEEFPGGGFVSGSFLDEQKAKQQRHLLGSVLEARPSHAVRLARRRLGLVKNALLNKMVAVLIKVLARPHSEMALPDEPHDLPARPTRHKAPARMTGS